MSAMRFGRAPALAGACVLLCCTVATVAISADVAVTWKNGIQIESSDKMFQASVGGRIMYDYAFTFESDVPDTTVAGAAANASAADGAEFRRARIYLAGTLYGNTIYKMEWDFAGGKVVPKDVYLGLEGIPVVGHVQVGNQYEPLSLDETTGSKYITFLERGLQTVFAPSRNPGIMVYNNVAGGRVFWSAGLFREDADNGVSQGDGEYAQTFRLTGLPVLDDGGRTLVHIGGAYSHRVPPGRMVSYSFRPESHLAPKVIEAKGIEAEDVTLLSGEGAIVAGPFSVQGEVIYNRINGPVYDPAMMAFSVFGSFFVTGENRTYRTSAASFDRVKPRKNFDGKGGSGAVELAARYSRADLNDKGEGLEAGTLDDITLGLNWYLNPNARVMANYVMGMIDNPNWPDEADDATVHSLLTRFQIDF